jgi:hypothetical protein
MPRLAPVAPPSRQQPYRSGRRHPRPVFGLKPTRGEPLVLLPTFPGRPAAGAAGIWPEPPAAMSEGRIASLGKLPRSFVRSKGIYVRNQKVLGAR